MSGHFEHDVRKETRKSDSVFILSLVLTDRLGAAVEPHQRILNTAML